MLHFPLSTFCNLQTSMTKALKWLQHHGNLFGQHKHAIQDQLFLCALIIFLIFE